MSELAWKTKSTGEIEISFGSSNGDVPSLHGMQNIEFKKCLYKWATPAKYHSERTGVPIAWIISLIYVTSKGDVTYLQKFENGDSEAGLMGIRNTWKNGLSDDQLAMQNINLLLGTNTLSKIRQYTSDLPSVASIYSSGCILDTANKMIAKHSKFSPWGLEEPTGYIMSVVRANNAWHNFTRSQTDPNFVLTISLPPKKE